MPSALNSPPRLLDPIRGDRKILLVVAAPTEAKAIVRGVTGSDPNHLRIVWKPVELNDRVSLLLTGVGKSNAAGATGHALSPERHGAVISIGVGGALPDPESERGREFPFSIGDTVRCPRSVFADEGVATGSGWQSMAERGFGPRQGLPDDRAMSIEADRKSLDLLEQAVPLLGNCATVSTCSGHDEQAVRIARRTGCTVEAMEGAAVGLAVLRIAPQIPFLELRVVSNRTGADPRWDLPLALEHLALLAASL